MAFWEGPGWTLPVCHNRSGPRDGHLDGARTPRPILQTRFSENYASFSPDARFVYYTERINVMVKALVASGYSVAQATQVATENIKNAPPKEAAA